MSEAICKSCAELSLVGDQLTQMQKLQEYLKGLEEEHLKLEAFKRELPFCMQLLNDAIEASKEQLANYKSTAEILNCCIKEEQNRSGSSCSPVLEEFIPIRKRFEESGKKFEETDLKKARYAEDDRPNWMSSAQLWSQNQETKEGTMRQQHSDLEQTSPVNAKLLLDSKHRFSGAFIPFSRERQETPSCSVERTLPDLALSSGEQDAGFPVGCNESVNLSQATSRNKPKETPIEFIPRTNGTNPSPTESQSRGQTQRKPRRCWSPELHRKFVNALQQLGGSQVSTPKQIRELMKVDGLTNDEVKSHLQKYRLHTRRCSPTPESGAAQPPQLVVLGGIWVPPEYATHQATALYSPLPTTSIQPHSRYCEPNSMPQEFYSQMNQYSQLHLYPCDLQKQGSSHSQGFPQCGGHESSGARGGGTVEDGKSKTSSSCKEEDNTGNVEMTEFGRGLSLTSHPRHQSVGDDEEGEGSRGSESTLRV